MNKSSMALAFIVGALAFTAGRFQAPVQTVDAQAAPGGIQIAAAAGQNVAYCFVYNAATKQLNSYTQKASKALELSAIRYTGGDFNSVFKELPSSRSKTSVSKMAALAKEIAEAQKKRKK